MCSLFSWNPDHVPASVARMSARPPAAAMNSSSTGKGGAGHFDRLGDCLAAHRSGLNGAIAGCVLPVTICSARSLPVTGPNTMPHMPWPPAT